MKRQTGLFTVEVDTLLTKELIYYKVTSTLSEAKYFPFLLVKNREKYNFGYCECHIPFLQKLDRKYREDDGYVYTQVYKYLERFRVKIRDQR